MTEAAFRAAKGAGLEYLADIVRHGLFVSQGHRDDVSVALVLEKSRDYSRVVELQGAPLVTAQIRRDQGELSSDPLPVQFV